MLSSWMVVEVAKNYIKYGAFVIDFLAFLPIIIQVLLVGDPSFQSNGGLLRLLHLLRVVRLNVRMGSVSQGHMIPAVGLSDRALTRETGRTG